MQFFFAFIAALLWIFREYFLDPALEDAQPLDWSLHHLLITYKHYSNNGTLNVQHFTFIIMLMSRLVMAGFAGFLRLLKNLSFLKPLTGIAYY